jgi:uncharacterized membrane protein
MGGTEAEKVSVATGQLSQNGDRDGLADARGAVAEEIPGMDRIKFFSDAVFAIAITLLILDVALPAGTAESNLAHKLNSIWPAYGAFAFTFLLIGLRWLTHLVQFRHIRDYDYTLLGLNLALLFVVAFLPFASRVLAAYPSSRPASVLYGVSMAVAGLFSTLLWWHACRAGLVPDSPELDTYLRRNYLERWVALPVLFGVAVVLVLLVPNLWWARAVALATPVVQMGIAVRARRAGHPL